MKFNKIVCIDKAGLDPWAIEELKKYSKNPVEIFDDYPQNNDEIISRIKDADCVLVSWNTQIDKEVIEKCNHIKYIGMCCSLYDEISANVDIKTARESNIDVRGVRDYGDEGLVEFIISELIRLIKGLGECQWKDEPMELTQKKIGIIGMGTTGRMLAKRASAFGMKVYYFSRNRKLDIEKEGIEYLSLNELLSTTEIISIHLPKNTMILGKDEFSLFGKGKILVNTSLDLPFDVPAFLEWIQIEGNFAIYDEDGVGRYQQEFQKYPNIILSKKVAGWTKEARQRLSSKVLQNIEEFLGYL
ncbi:dihydrofolate reductase [Clostridium sp. FP2]|uniref:NAD(P)-dependent oxidoreductase n=1 Tax=Clostridium TaxID=1485 RepID=UPI0013E97279|nr:MULTISPECIES: NAD(P)-dependent oxidoreductase [Clostridium]MBW9158207.1 dihydrofolate reductase [Clostridium tagluense]MBZ9623362.1 dihydrofolate reductase [Clostridium sp. FP2]WLC67528.1 dihydrofolate reductase [Clostridium tagluense]